MKTEYKRVVEQASDEQLGRWIIKNMLGQDESKLEANAQFIATMLREVRRQSARPEAALISENAALKEGWLELRKRELISKGMKIEQACIHAEVELSSGLNAMRGELPPQEERK